VRVPGFRVVVGLSAIVLMSVFVVAPSASAGGASGFQPISTSFVPQSSRAAGSKPVSVIAELSDDPLTVAQADATSPLTPAETQQVQATVVHQQATVTTKIDAIGGKIQRRYQRVLNAMVVSIPADQVSALAATPGVKSVHAVTKVTLDNTRNIPFIGVPSVWSGAAGGGTPFHGEGMKIGIIDTGIDYTHADFGGPATVAAYQAALATDTAPPDPSMVGCATCRVKGGTDLVGDAYTGGNTPVPDSNPLDCNSHGTHVAGTAAGSGVLADGSTYTGPYDANTVSSHSWNVGPGAAPEADIYSIRVFGCTGSTQDDIIISALEWASANGMQVVNLSLGAPYGGADSPEIEAMDNLSKAGTIVVAAAGNQGPNPYLFGSPGSATSSISVAASSLAQFSNIGLSTGPTVSAIQADDVPPTNLGTLPVVVLPDGSGGISLGCNPSEYQIPAVVGALVVVARGTCARVDRAIYGQQAGAAAVVMVNSSSGYPPYEGPITVNPDTSVPYHVTIPFLGVQTADGAALLAAAGGTAQFTPGTAADLLASFSSGGARSGDSALKPDVSAPGEGVVSAGMGTGTGALSDSGTSMASPLTAGMAALVREAHPSWKKVEYWKAAVVNTASADGITNYQTRNAGAGLIQAYPAVATDTVATASQGTATLSYGEAELTQDYQSTKTVTLKNFSSVPETFDIGTAHDAGSPHSVVTAPSVVVPAKGTAKVAVELDVPAATAGDSSAFRDVAGLVTFTPEAGANHGVSLSVPYYLVPRATSSIKTSLRVGPLVKAGSGVATTTNTGVIGGSDEWFDWGLSKPKDTTPGEIDLRAVGAAVSGSNLAFAVSTYGRWSNPAADEFDIRIDVNGDGVDDYVAFAADEGRLETGSANGVMGTAVASLVTGTGYIVSTTDAPFNDATLVMTIPQSYLCLASTPCLSSGDGRISYDVSSYSATGGSDSVAGRGLLNTVTPALSAGMLDSVAPGASVPETVSYDATEFAVTPGLGFMIVSHDNQSANGRQAQLIKVTP
jgi:minor extracellular serine protease Vpr